MGYEPGKGLGKSLQGISTPVEAQLRKGRGAIGAYGPEKFLKVAKKKEEESTSRDESSKEAKTGKAQNWRKGDGSSKKKVTYRSIDQVLEDGKLKSNKSFPINTEISRTKVIDMTGPQQRVFSGYHGISSGQQQPTDDFDTGAKKHTNFALPELQHNLNLLVNMCEQDLIQNDRKNHQLDDRAITLENEKKNLTKIVDQHAQLIDTLENVLNVIEKLMNKTSDMSLEEVAAAFSKLQNSHYEEYKMYELGELARTLVEPKMKEYLSNWNPLMQPKHPIKRFQQWKDILQVGMVSFENKNMPPYDQLVWNSWMPSIRGVVQ